MKLNKYLNEDVIDEAFNKKIAQSWFDSLWDEAEDRGGKFGDGMMSVLQSFKATFLK